jgi:flavin-dependent dehydrogenase
MKRRVAIIGTGHAGLQLGIGLLRHGYEVLFINDKTADQIINNPPTSSQGMFTTAHSYEAALGLNFWDDVSPKNETVTLNIINPLSKNIDLQWRGKVSGKLQSIDQRLKFPRWMQEAVKLGGKFRYQFATVEDADKLTAEYDLVLLATGKGQLSSYLERDPDKSVFTTPQRNLCLIYAKNVEPAKVAGVRIHIVPQIGEYSVINGLGLHGACEMMLFEGIIGGVFDSWKNIDSPQECLNHGVKLLKEYIPQEAKRYESAELSGLNAVLRGCVTPTVRKPVLTLPSGRHILGLADAVILNDPIAGQGSNCASKCAHLYLNAIQAFQESKFTVDWMQHTFDQYWEQYGRWSTYLANTLLQPPSKSMLDLLASAEKNQIIADLLANSFNKPEEFPLLLQNSALCDVRAESNRSERTLRVA